MVEVSLGEVDRRVTTLEVELGRHGDRLRQIEQAQAVQGADIRAIGADMQEIKQDIRRVLWAVILSAIGAAMGFLISGGFAV